MLRASDVLALLFIGFSLGCYAGVQAAHATEPRVGWLGEGLVPR